MGSCYSNFERVIIPWPDQLNVASLLRGILTPRQVRSSCLWIMTDMTRPSESGLSMLLRNTTGVVIITLGLMTFGVWYEWDSGNAGPQNFGDFLKRESSKWGCQTPLCVSNGGTIMCIEKLYTGRHGNLTLREPFGYSCSIYTWRVHWVIHILYIDWRYFTFIGLSIIKKINTWHNFFTGPYYKWSSVGHFT